MRELPLLEEIRLLRQLKDDAEHKLMIAQSDNEVLVQRVRELEQATFRKNGLKGRVTRVI